MNSADGINVLEIDEWSTPATGYPLSKGGRARITRATLKANAYRMEGVRGYDCYRLKKPIPVTSLKASAYLPGARVMVWGIKDSEINPAVTKVSML